MGAWFRLRGRELRRQRSRRPGSRGRRRDEDPRRWCLADNGSPWFFQGEQNSHWPATWSRTSRRSRRARSRPSTSRASWSTRTAAPRPPSLPWVTSESVRPNLSALVVGAGFGGIAAAVELRRRGVDLIVLEKADRVGGVWRDNTYPGAACDVPSSLYSYSFAPHAGVATPLRRAARHPRLHRVRGRASTTSTASIRTGTEVTDAAWDDADGRWKVQHPDRRVGPDPTYDVDVLVTAVGQLSRPSVPRPPGHRVVRGPRVPLRRVGPRRRPARASGSRSSAPAPARSSSSPTCSRQAGAGDGLPALGAVRRAEARPGLHAAAPPRLPPRAAHAGLRPGADPQPERACSTWRWRSRPRSPRRSSPRSACTCATR